MTDTVDYEPKSYGSINKNDFRIDYNNLSVEEVERLGSILYNSTLQKALSANPVMKYNDMEFVGNGWEWSVFKKDLKVYKIPAEIFDEVNTKKYLENTEKAYGVVREYYPEKFVAKTNFIRQHNSNLIIQEHIEGYNLDNIQTIKENIVLKNNFVKILESTLKLLNEYNWMPDFNLSKEDGEFKVTNIIVEKVTNTPKIIDFTYYFDPFRLYPQLTETVVKDKIILIKEILKEIS